MKTKLLFLLVLAFVSSSSTKAQQAVYDEQKFKQWNAIENGGWDFAPDGYYYLFHKNYSGAHWKWQWHGFKSGPVIRFDENDSNVKRTITERLAQVAASLDTKAKTQAELDTITPVYNEEMIRTAERNVDLMYNQFKDDFTKNQATITEALTYCLTKSNGRLYEAVLLLQNENNVILSDIDYIHKTGVGYEMENTKRQIAYEEQLVKMEKLASLSAKLMLYAKTFYAKKPKFVGGDIIDITPKK